MKTYFKVTDIFVALFVFVLFICYFLHLHILLLFFSFFY